MADWPVIGAEYADGRVRVGVVSSGDCDIVVRGRYPWDVTIAPHVRIMFEQGQLVTEGNTRMVTPSTGLWFNRAAGVRVPAHEVILAAAERSGVPVEVRPGDEALYERLVEAGRQHLRPPD